MSEPPPAARPIRARATEQHGSNAGAGSGAFSLYRKNRRVELERVEKMNLEQAEEEKRGEMDKKLRKNLQEEETRTEKNRKKRQRRKNVKKGEDEEESELTPEETQALNEIANQELESISKLKSGSNIDQEAESE